MRTNINIDLFFDYLHFATHFYTPTKYNKKKIKSLFESLPFFLPVSEQNKIYKLFLKYPVDTFYDTTAKMKEYGYLIYMEYHKENKQKYLDYPKYLDRLETKIYKDDMTFTKRRVHTILFSIVLILLIICLYKL
jgi:hypothetical protein